MVSLQRLVLLVAVLLASCSGGGEDLGGERLPTDAVGLQDLAATAMGEVTSVRFGLDRSGAPVFIDPAQSISLDRLDGRFSAPASADALLGVTVNGSLRTELGAIAIDEEIWLSNPVTGEFETLPPGFDIDPSMFFDPRGGWQPLIEDLTDITFVAEEQRNDTTRYHLTGTAPAERMQAITAGLVRGQDIDLDLWLHPVTAEVSAIEFSTEFDDGVSEWILELTEYGGTFEILPPEE